MPEYTGLHTFKGNPLTLVGQEVNVGDQAPDAALITTGMLEKRISEAKGKVLLLSVTPSLDTGICAMQLRKFNKTAAELDDDVLIWNVSVDLPFAISRFCGSEGIENADALSDYRDREFGGNYGLYIKEMGLLARSLWVIDRDGKVAYKQIVPELASEPDYDPALEAAKAAL